MGLWVSLRIKIRKILKINHFFAFLQPKSHLRKDREPNPDQDPDPVVRGMDPLIRIQIHTKMSWIRNTGIFIPFSCGRIGSSLSGWERIF
jgi:hypothetical protein